MVLQSQPSAVRRSPGNWCGRRASPATRDPEWRQRTGRQRENRHELRCEESDAVGSGKGCFKLPSEQKEQGRGPPGWGQCCSLPTAAWRGPPTLLAGVDDVGAGRVQLVGVPPWGSISRPSGGSGQAGARAPPEQVGTQLLTALGEQGHQEGCGS